MQGLYVWFPNLGRGAPPCILPCALAFLRLECAAHWQSVPALAQCFHRTASAAIWTYTLGGIVGENHISNTTGVLGSSHSA